jgi:hypothetical protein
MPVTRPQRSKTKTVSPIMRAAIRRFIQAKCKASAYSYKTAGLTRSRDNLGGVSKFGTLVNKNVGRLSIRNLRIQEGGDTNNQELSADDNYFMDISLREIQY